MRILPFFIKIVKVHSSFVLLLVLLLLVLRSLYWGLIFSPYTKHSEYWKRLYVTWKPQYSRTAFGLGMYKLRKSVDRTYRPTSNRSVEEVGPISLPLKLYQLRIVCTICCVPQYIDFNVGMSFYTIRRTVKCRCWCLHIVNQPSFSASLGALCGPVIYMLSVCCTVRL
jgi:hypothetical protein